MKFFYKNRQIRANAMREFFSEITPWRTLRIHTSTSGFYQFREAAHVPPGRGLSLPNRESSKICEEQLHLNIALGRTRAHGFQMN